MKRSPEWDLNVFCVRVCVFFQSLMNHSKFILDFHTTNNTLSTFNAVEIIFSLRMNGKRDPDEEHKHILTTEYKLTSDYNSPSPQLPPVRSDEGLHFCTSVVEWV